MSFWDYISNGTYIFQWMELELIFYTKIQIFSKQNKFKVWECSKVKVIIMNHLKFLVISSIKYKNLAYRNMCKIKNWHYFEE